MSKIYTSATQLILILLLWSVDMSYTVVKLSQLATVPAVGSTYEVTGDALVSLIECFYDEVSVAS